MLEEAGITDAAFESEYLVRLATGFSRAAFFAGAALESGAAARYDDLLARRACREPAAYIAGEREFFGLAFAVTPAVLIPRPETELLVETALAELPADGNSTTVADIGTGSGCIAIAIAHARPGLTVVATDRSAAALDIARGNGRRHNAQVEWLRADLAAPISRADIVVANLPYIPFSKIASLEPEVREWEPRMALDGGPDGLALIRRLIADCAARLRPRLLALEVAAGEANAVASIGRQAGATVDVRRDLAGIERMVCARWA